MNLVQHDNSTLFETKSSYYRAALKGLPCYAVVMNLIQPAEPFQTPCNCRAWTDVWDRPYTEGTLSKHSSVGKLITAQLLYIR